MGESLQGGNLRIKQNGKIAIEAVERRVAVLKDRNKALSRNGQVFLEGPRRFQKRYILNGKHSHSILNSIMIGFIHGRFLF